MRFQPTAVVSLLPALAAAVAPPAIDGFSLLFSDDFAGAAGASPNSANWNIAQAINTNDEAQTYTVSNQNIQISGGATVQFVPRKSTFGQTHWTSGRIETVGAWTPAAGKVMIIQSSILLGGNAQANKQGIWPAFWALGDAMRHGTPWPLAGEIDIMEQVNGAPTAYGTVHCDVSSGGACHEPSGIAGTVAMPAAGFNTWGVRIDLTSADWTQQTIQWQLNGATFQTLSGAAIGSQAIWATLAHSPLYILLNVAVGGDWPGQPNAATLDGYGAMMEVGYVAVYSS